MIEPLLIENKNRFVLFPIKHHDIWELYKLSQSSLWIAEEIDFSLDKNDWDLRLNNNERFFIKNILAFFAFSDGIVNENLALNFHNEIQIPEVRCLYTGQMQIESIHSECYSLMIDTYITDSEEKNKMFNSLESNPIVSKKAEWGLKWITNGTFAERLLAFGVIEGVFFSGSFCAIFWLKSRGLMPALCMSNQFISRDEALHCHTCVLLYSKLIYTRLSEKRVHEIFTEAYLIEKEFITKSIPVSLIGMNNTLMVQYIEFVCDYWLDRLGYSKLFNSVNPFPFMDYINIETKSNFFEKRESNYSKANISFNKESIIDNDFSIDYDF